MRSESESNLRLPAILVLLIIFSSLSSSVVSAEAIFSNAGDDDEQDESEEDETDTDEDDDDDNSDSDEDDEWDEERHLGEHEVEVEASDEEATIHLKRETEDYESKIEVKFDTEKATLELKFEEEVGNSETESEIDVELQQVVEYNDSNQNGIFDPSEEVLEAWNLFSDAYPLDSEIAAKSSTWQDISATGITKNGINGWQISATALLGVDGASFTIDLFVFGQFTPIEGGNLSPTDVKIDFGFYNIPAQSNESAIALLFELESKQECESIDDEDEEEYGYGASFNDGDVASMLSFMWLDYASVDGTNQSVNTTEIAWDGDSDGSEFMSEKLLLFSYPHGAEIIHDPKLSVKYGLQTPSGETNPPGQTNEMDITTLVRENVTLTILILIVFPALLLLATIYLRGGRIVEDDENIAEPLIPWLLPPPPAALFNENDEGGASR